MSLAKKARKLKIIPRGLDRIIWCDKTQWKSIMHST